MEIVANMDMYVMCRWHALRLKDLAQATAVEIRMLDQLMRLGGNLVLPLLLAWMKLCPAAWLAVD